jgi:hypothetical protein
MLLLIGIGAAVWSDKGSWINAVVTGQCNACPAPKQCRIIARRGGPLSIDGCGHSLWKRG